MRQSLLYEKEVYEIIGVAIEVHKELVPGFLESIYEKALAVESKKRKIPHKTQVNISVYYKKQKLNKEFVAGYIGYGKIIIELKCIHKLTKVEEAQILNYLKSTGLKVGLLVNFGSQGKLEWKRYIRTGIDK